MDVLRRAVDLRGGIGPGKLEEAREAQIPLKSSSGSRKDSLGPLSSQLYYSVRKTGPRSGREPRTAPRATRAQYTPTHTVYTAPTVYSRVVPGQGSMGRVGRRVVYSRVQAEQGTPPTYRTRPLSGTSMSVSFPVRLPPAVLSCRYPGGGASLVAGSSRCPRSRAGDRQLAARRGLGGRDRPPSRGKPRWEA